jgi:hypothetical protein
MGIIINPLQGAPLVAQSQVINVDDAGESVTIHFGNAKVTMHYETALKVSQLLRVHAKKAKRRAGDVSRHWSVIGMLEGLKN